MLKASEIKNNLPEGLRISSLQHISVRELRLSAVVYQDEEVVALSDKPSSHLSSDTGSCEGSDTNHWFAIISDNMNQENK